MKDMYVVRGINFRDLQSGTDMEPYTERERERERHRERQREGERERQRDRERETDGHTIWNSWCFDVTLEYFSIVALISQKEQYN